MGQGYSPAPSHRPQQGPGTGRVTEKRHCFLSPPATSSQWVWIKQFRLFLSSQHFLWQGSNSWRCSFLLRPVWCVMSWAWRALNLKARGSSCQKFWKNVCMACGETREEKIEINGTILFSCISLCSKQSSSCICSLRNCPSTDNERK